MPGFWKIIAGRENAYIGDFEAEGCIAIGWGELGDLSAIGTEDQLAQHFDETYPKCDPGRRGVQLGVVTRFRFGMEPGDVVISYDPGAREYLWATRLEYRPKAQTEGRTLSRLLTG